MVPPLPSKALKRQMPFRSDDGIYEEGFIEERRSALEAFVNKIAGWFKNYSWHCNPDPFCQKFDGLVSGHPLAQNERCLHMFLQVGWSLKIIIKLLPCDYFLRRRILTGITCPARSETHRIENQSFVQGRHLPHSSCPACDFAQLSPNTVLVFDSKGKSQ